MIRSPRRLRNPKAEAARFRARALIGFVVVVLALGGLAAWYFRLQVLEYSDYARQSEANRVKPRPVVPGRGLIYDRKGRILADNVPAYRLEVTPEEAGDTDALIEGLSRIVALDPTDVARFREERRVNRGFRPITLKLRVEEHEAARFAVDRWRFPGVEVVPYLNRRYPYGDLFAHVVGYVGRTDEGDVDRYGRDHVLFPHTGRTGLERSYEDLLRGAIGYEQVETNVEGRALGILDRQPATAGADLRLSIDLDLQQAMVRAFGELHGSAVAVEPATGQVLGMVSLPAFDPNLFVNGISHADYRRLMDDPAKPLFNRNVLGGGPPGSTIKPFVALAGVDSGMRRPEDTVFSTGEFFIPGQSRGYRDAGGGAGRVDLRDSISRSINFYYYKLAYEMGIARFAEYMERYGFGQPTGIDLVGENAGVVPSPQWKAGRSPEPWYPGETVIAGIGQGYWIATALQLARGTAAIANGGELHPLRLVAGVRKGYDQPWSAVRSPSPPRITDNPAHLAAVQEGMVATIHGRGTATAMARDADYTMAGKTGTAQRVGRRGNARVDPRSLPYHLRHQALFIGYAPAEAPTIAVAVVVEHGGYGGVAAAPIARKIFDAWILGEAPEPEQERGDAVAASGGAARAHGAVPAGESQGAAGRAGSVAAAVREAGL
ncbi:penicillin-binding protein 2 [Luteimonas sp. RD2P54]|uniref:Peptidoglycan D,D-transpeptidase MrdA n=1 Tax=Luteimonas endophytica TaxID=3042023 RepID=A0ABT6JCY9_9GAMM|nr:penicillin-binding protein 2 [Luteimonas endophytica]MDH5824694.1 penicillin-binding protein 2 [Luteimonas endophytica]